MEELMSLHTVSSETYKNASNEEKTSNKLYFLFDTKEIYKGTECYTDSVVLYTGSEPSVKSKGKIYINSDTLECKIYNGSGWINLNSSKNENVFNVKKYGAVGDGVTDDSAAIQTALNECLNAGGGVVYFPANIYLINTCLYYNSNMTLYFENGAILLRGNASLRYLLANDIDNTVTGYNGTENVQIVGATFDGNISFGTTSINDNKCTLLNTGHAKDIIVENCTFKNGNVWHFYEVCGSENIKIINCVFDGSNYSGTTSQQDGYSELLQFDNDLILENGSAAYGATKNGTSGDLTPCKNIHIKGCKFICNGYCNAIGNHNPQTYNHSQIRISDCYFTGGGGTGGYIDFDSSTIEVDIYNNTFDGDAVTITASNSKVIIHDNRIDNASNAYSGSLIAYCNLINGSMDGEGVNDVVESIDFNAFGTMRTGDSTYGYATLSSSNIKKYRGRLMGELKFTKVTTNSNFGVLPVLVNEEYRPKVTAGITAEQQKIVGTGYISADSTTMRVMFPSALSSKDITVRFDYSLKNSNETTYFLTDADKVEIAEKVVELIDDSLLSTLGSGVLV